MNEQIKYFMSSITKHELEVFRLCMDLCEQKNTSSRSAKEYNEHGEEDILARGKTFEGIIKGYILILETLSKDIHKKLDANFLIALHEQALFFKQSSGKISGSLGCSLTKKTSSFYGIRSMLINPITSCQLMLVPLKGIEIDYTWLSQIYIKYTLNILKKIPQYSLPLKEQIEDLVSQIESKIARFINVDDGLSMFEQTFKDFIRIDTPQFEALNKAIHENEIQTLLSWKADTIEGYIRLLHDNVITYTNYLEHLCKAILVNANIVISDELFKSICMEIKLSFQNCFNLDSRTSCSIEEYNGYFDWFDIIQYGIARKSYGFGYHPKTEGNNFIAKNLDLIIKLYNEHIMSTCNDEEKISIIVDAIMHFERLHPFNDGNCRVFCVILLNYLLLQNNLKPCLMENPNCFDGFSKEELINEVKKGQTNFAIIFPESNVSSKDVDDKIIKLSLRDTKLEHTIYPELLGICTPLIKYCNRSLQFSQLAQPKYSLRCVLQ